LSAMNGTSTEVVAQIAVNQVTHAHAGSGGRRRKYPKLHKPDRAGVIQVLVYDNRKIKAQRSGAAGLCPCNAHWSKHELRIAERQLRQASRRRVKEERLHKKQKKLSRKLAMALTHDGQCSYEKMNCFSHDNDHWKTAPLWNDGPFCVCMNANNNTYWCIRTLNATHNSLYCEFITGFVTYYDMRIDPYQLRNIAHTLSEQELAFFHHTLQRMRVCKGADCFINSPLNNNSPTFHQRSGKTAKGDRFWRRSQRRREPHFSSSFSHFLQPSV